MADDIIVGSVAVDIVPDTRKFKPDLQAKLQGITVDVGVRADTSGIRAELDDVTRTRSVTIEANADTAAASAQIDEAARNRTATINTRVDGSPAFLRTVGGFGALTTSAITLGPALIPILATVGAIGLALGAPLVVAGAGATVFGFLAGFAVSKTNQQLKDIQTTATKLAGLKKGTDEYAATQQKLAAQQSALTPAQKKYADSLDHVKAVFGGFLGGKIGNELLGPVSAFLTLAADVLPKLAPIIGAVSGALTTLLGGLGDAVKGPDFQAFVTAFSKQIGPDIVAFGRIAGNVFKGVAGLVTQLGDAFGPGLLKGLENLTGKFAALGDQGAHSKALRDFVDYFHRVGPQVGDTLGAVAKAVGHIVAALAPLGPPALKVVEGIADAISAIPIPVLTALAASFVAMVAAAKVGKGLSALGLLSGGGGLGKGGGVLGQFVSAAKPVPVFVTNPGFVPNTKGPGPIVDPRSPGVAAASGEAEAIKAAKAAAEAARAAGGGAAAESQAAARAFKEAMAAHDAAVLKEALSFGVKGGIRGLVGTLLAAPAGVALADVGAEVPDNPFKMDTGSAQRQSNDFFKQQFAGATTVPSAAVLKAFNLTPGQARALLGLTQLKATTTGLDSLRGSLDKASNGFDIVGHSAHRNFGSIQADARALQSKLDSIRDKKLTIILDDLRAVRSLEALQAFRFRDKTININERERAVGPGGGAGHPLAPQAAPRPSSGGGGSGGGGGALVNIEHAHVADTNDLLRKSGDALRGRAGGGVLLRPPPTPVF